MQARGHEVLVMADPGSPPVKRALDYGLQVDESIYFSQVSRTLRHIRLFSDFIKAERPDIIVAHRGESHLLAALAVKKSRLEIPVVRYRGDVRLPAKSFLNRWLTNRLTAAIGVSTGKHRRYYLENFRLQSMGADRDRLVRVIYPGIDTARFKPLARNRELAARLGLEKDDIVIGLVGRLAAVKGHKIFIEAAKIVSLAEKKAKFIIAGKDEALSAGFLKEMATALGLEKTMIFLGEVEDIREVYALLDIGVIASTGSEAISRVLLEYMACGVPVIGTAVNQIPEVLKENGLIVTPGEVIDLAEAEKKMAGDEKFRNMLAAKALDDVRTNFSLEALGKNSEDFLAEVLDGTNQPLP